VRSMPVELRMVTGRVEPFHVFGGVLKVNFGGRTVPYCYVMFGANCKVILYLCL
jgi:hypothetical protein